MKLAAAFSILLLFVSRSLAATTPHDPHADLSAALKNAQVGTLIRIGTGAGVLEGKFQGMAPAGVRVMNPKVSTNAAIVVLADSIRTVQKESRHTRRGMVIGSLVGFAVGYALGSVGYSSD